MNRADLIDWSLYRLLQILPIDACSALGGRLSRRMGSAIHPVPDRRARALIASVRPDLDPDAAMLRLWDSVARTHAEFAAIGRILAAGRVSMRGEEHLARALAGGRPVIAMFLHIGNWELAAMQVAYRAPDRAVAIYDPPSSRARRQIAEAGRGIAPWRLRAMSPTVWRDAIETLSRPGGVLIAAGDEIDDGRVGAPFFGRAPFADGNLGKLARIALRTGALVAPIYTERLDGANFVTHVLPPLDFSNLPRTPDAIAQATLAMEAAIAEPVRRLIDQWYMAFEWNK
jgi:Kdo2-lipid IVA lauroyltransferase/acyltransferase